MLVAGAVRTITRGLTVALTLAALALRLTGAGRARAAAALLLLAALLNGVATLADVGARRLPWTRLVLPLFVAGELALYLGGGLSATARTALLATLELAVVVLAVGGLARRGRPSGASDDGGDDVHAQLAARLERFLPPSVARLLALELTIVGSALAAPFRRARPLGAGEHAYAESSPLRWLPWVVLLSMPADLAIVHALVPARHAVWRWLIDASDLYAVVWVGGLYATMRRRPHRVRDGVIELRRGVMHGARVAAGDVVEARVHPSLTRGELRALGADGWLAAARAPLVELLLATPVTVTRVWGAASPPTLRLMVAADDAERLRAAVCPSDDRRR